MDYDPMNGMKQFNEAMQKVSAAPPWQSGKLKQHQRWNPYSMEGGYLLHFYIVHVHG